MGFKYDGKSRPTTKKYRNNWNDIFKPKSDFKCIDCGQLTKPDEWASKFRCIDCGPTEEELDNDQNNNNQ